MADNFYANYPVDSNSGGTVTNVTASSPLSSSGGTTPNISLTGIVPIANGGTNNSTAYTAGSIIFSNGTSLTQSNVDLFFDNTNKRVGLGTTTPSRTIEIDSQSAGTVAGMFVKQFSNSTSDSPFVGMAKIGGTIASPLATPVNSALFVLSGSGHNGTALTGSSVQILGVAAETFTPSAQGANIIFATTAVGTTTRKSRISVTTAGSLRFFGNTSGTLDISPPAVITSYNVTLPAAQGAAATVLTNDGTGLLSWSAVPTPTGATNSVAFFNNAGVLANDTNVEYTTSVTPAFPPFPMRGFFAKTDIIPGAPPVFTFGALDTAIDTASTQILILSGSNTAVGAVNDTGDVAMFTGAVTDATSSARTGAVSINSGNNQGTGASGAIALETGQTIDGSTGSIQSQTGQPQGAGNSGSVFFNTGQTKTGSSGLLTFSSGGSLTGGTTGDIDFRTGDSNASGSSQTGSFNVVTGNSFDGLSGNINITTGIPSGAGDSGTFNMTTGQSGPTGKSGDANLGTGPSGGSGDTGRLNLFTGSGGATTGLIDISTGNSSGGNSGNIVIQLGTATGTRGVLQIQDGSEGTAGWVWTSTDTIGSGAWTPSGGAGANTSLSNLSSVAFNADISPATDATLNFGDSSHRINDAFIKTFRDNIGNQAIQIGTNQRNILDGSESRSVDAQTRQLFDSSEVEALDYQNRMLVDNTGTNNLDFSTPGVIAAVGNISAATMTPANGATGTFTTVDLKTVTVTNGIITSIV